VIAYLAIGLPAVLGGVRFVHGGGVYTTAREAILQSTVAQRR